MKNANRPKFLQFSWGLNKGTVLITIINTLIKFSFKLHYAFNLFFINNIKKIIIDYL